MTDVQAVRWSTWLAPSLTSGVIRSKPADFCVDEILPFEPEGEGEHLWLHVRKTGTNTEFAARAIAKALNVSPRNVSYAGLKDRHAVTMQWFSAHALKEPDAGWGERLPPEIEVLAIKRGRRKLRTGSLSGNRFVITLRECVADRAALEASLARMQSSGVPNFFGEQRFGRERDNLAQALALFEDRIRVRDHKRRGLYLSAARSWIFNQVLDARIRAGQWDQLLEGEVFMLDGSHSWFVSQALDAEIEDRYARMDIHPTGPLWGAGELASHGAVRVLEERIAGESPAFCAGLAKFGLKQERRALRMRVDELVAEWPEDDVLRLSFTLPAGAYATAVLRELGPLRDAQRAESDEWLLPSEIAAQGKGAANVTLGVAARLVLRIQRVELGAHRFGDVAAVAGEAEFLGADRLHVAQLRTAFGLHHFAVLQRGDIGARGLLCLEALQHLLFPGIRGVVRVADLERGAGHRPGAGGRKVIGDFRRTYVADFDCRDRTAALHRGLELGLQAAAKLLHEVACLADVGGRGRIGREGGQGERQQCQGKCLFHGAVPRD